MQNYWIEVKASMPAPRKRDITIEASSFGTALQRAVKAFRKEIGQKRIDELSVIIKRLKTIKKGACQATNTENNNVSEKSDRQANISKNNKIANIGIDDFSNR
jgi:hypothetical protein